ncbi:hypothetical protein HMPREF0971_01701 [Segatella oris F0302]|uniref:Uncharacterized protein n=1 Tax=Segatella oris F0302 TaxID=649760 RepID=D1QRU6_9BACT|nr:hypothetical protein HMPREF0971_01701 [Segatella oris F0302]
MSFTTPEILIWAHIITDVNIKINDKMLLWVIVFLILLMTNKKGYI